VYGRHWSLTGRGVPSARTPDSAMYLPGRNVLLLGHAAVYAVGQGHSTLALGTLASNPFGDASQRFFTQFADCLSEALSARVRITTPLRTHSKRELINACSTLPLHVTFSCIHPRGMRHCGTCNKCAERRRAFRQAGIIDPTAYAYNVLIKQ
jgi:7-cyano-7-deazaguanine synthase